MCSLMLYDKCKIQINVRALANPAISRICEQLKVQYWISLRKHKIFFPKFQQKKDINLNLLTKFSIR